MKEYIKRVPLPLFGVILGVAVLGNLLQSYGEAVRYTCGSIATILLILLLLKLLLFPKTIKEDLQNPIMASVAATFPMALMILSTYMKPFIGVFAEYIWYFAIGLHIVLIIYFTVKFILKLQFQKVFASYFVVYVGIAVSAITAPTYGRQDIGTLAFWFGFVSLIVLLVLITYRYIKFKDIPNPAKPLLCIYAAPTSLCVVGYIQSVMPKSKSFLLLMFAVATILYFFALIKAIEYLKLPFFPSYSAFTFPFVISAIAAKQTMACLAKLESPMPSLQYLVLFETIVAIIFVVYVVVRFMAHIFGKKAAA